MAGVANWRVLTTNMVPRCATPVIADACTEFVVGPAVRVRRSNENSLDIGVPAGANLAHTAMIRR